jgi:conjugal transfer pilus assembly protein TraW
MGALIAVFAAAVIATGSAHAVNLGTIGPVYPIAEPDLLVDIQARLRALEKSGELARYEQDARKRLTHRVENPPPLPGISKATTASTHWYDPSVSFDAPIVDDRGRVLVAAGERRNPLDYVSYPYTLIFFDARDPAQGRYVADRMRREPARIKPILVGGSAWDLTRRWKTQVYADQDGKLVRQLGITEVPAVVVQDGQRLRVDTVALGEGH